MKAFPVVGRELRVASRKWSTYWNRCLVGLGAMLVAAFALIIVQQNVPKQSGIILFVWMSVIAYGHCLFMGLVLTSDSLSEEKREGTLGLLFLTDLRGYDVVLGKLAASSLRGFYGLLAIFPVLALCLLLGGVTAAEFRRVMLVCLNNLFLSMALGMMTSAMCREERKSMVLSFLILFFLCAGFPALGGWFAAQHPGAKLFAPLFLPSPGFSCFVAFDALYKREWFWPAVAVQHVLAWIALGIACWLVPRSWQDRIATARSERRQAAVTQWTYGPAAVRVGFRRRLLDANPYYWLTSRDRFKQTLPWIWLGGAGLIWLVGLAEYPTVWRDEGMYVTTAIVLHFIFKVWVGLEASRRLGADRQSGALELLLCTPLSEGALVKGQWLSVLRQFGVPVAVVVAADFIFFSAGARMAGNQKEWTYLWVCGVTVFVADLVALAWLAMWLGFTNRRTGQGGVSAIIQICALPWLIFTGFLAMLAVLDTFHVFRINSFGNSLFVVWWLISIGVDALLGINAYRRLNRHLRAIASERYVGRAALIGRALGLAFGRWKAER